MIRTDRVAQDRVYRELKSDLFSGVYQLRQRMDLATLARRYAASKTPVREAVFRLVAEQLLSQHPEGGYQIGVPDAARLAHLYFWNAQHLLAALHVTATDVLVRRLEPFLDLEIGTEPVDQAALVAAFFRAIGSATGNLEFIDRTEAANERLHYPRLAEANIFRDGTRELPLLFNFSGANVQKTVRRRILTYHRRRIEHAAWIAAMWSSKEKEVKDADRPRDSAEQ